MRQSSRRRQRLSALALFGLGLFSYPLLGLLRGPDTDWPAAWLYLFGVWGLLIVFACAIAQAPGGD